MSWVNIVTITVYVAIDREYCSGNLLARGCDGGDKFTKINDELITYATDQYTASLLGQPPHELPAAMASTRIKTGSRGCTAIAALGRPIHRTRSDGLPRLFCRSKRWVAIRRSEWRRCRDGYIQSSAGTAIASMTCNRDRRSVDHRVRRQQQFLCKTTMPFGLHEDMSSSLLPRANWLAMILDSAQPLVLRREVATATAHQFSKITRVPRAASE